MPCCVTKAVSASPLYQSLTEVNLHGVPLLYLCRCVVLSIDGRRTIPQYTQPSLPMGAVKRAVRVNIFGLKTSQGASL